MNIHDACEEAYKRGYERAKAEAEEEIKSKNAEIEKLTINMNAFGLGMKREKERADTTRAEAIKEFVERAKENQIDIVLYGNIVMVSTIDKIAKEMGVEI